MCFSSSYSCFPESFEDPPHQAPQPVCHEAENSSSELVLPSCSHPQPGVLRHSLTGPIAHLPTLRFSLFPAPRDCSKPKPSSSCPALKLPMAPYCLPDPNRAPWMLHIIPARPMSLHPLLTLGASHNPLSFMPLHMQFPLLGTPFPQCSSTSMVTPLLHVPCLPFTQASRCLCSPGGMPFSYLVSQCQPRPDRRGGSVAHWVDSGQAQVRVLAQPLPPGCCQFSHL